MSRFHLLIVLALLLASILNCDGSSDSSDSVESVSPLSSDDEEQGSEEASGPGSSSAARELLSDPKGPPPDILFVVPVVENQRGKVKVDGFSSGYSDAFARGLPKGIQSSLPEISGAKPYEQPHQQQEKQQQQQASVRINTHLYSAQAAHASRQDHTRLQVNPSEQQTNIDVGGYRVVDQPHRTHNDPSNPTVKGTVPHLHINQKPTPNDQQQKQPNQGSRIHPPLNSYHPRPSVSQTGPHQRPKEIDVYKPVGPAPLSGYQKPPPVPPHSYQRQPGPLPPQNGYQMPKTSPVADSNAGNPPPIPTVYIPGPAPTSADDFAKLNLPQDVRIVFGSPDQPTYDENSQNFNQKPRNIQAVSNYGDRPTGAVGAPVDTLAIDQFLESLARSHLERAKRYDALFSNSDGRSINSAGYNAAMSSGPSQDHYGEQQVTYGSQDQYSEHPTMMYPHGLEVSRRVTPSGSSHNLESVRMPVDSMQVSLKPMISENIGGLPNVAYKVMPITDNRKGNINKNNRHDGYMDMSNIKQEEPSMRYEVPRNLHLGPEVSHKGRRDFDRPFRKVPPSRLPGGKLPRHSDSEMGGDFIKGSPPRVVIESGRINRRPDPAEYDSLVPKFNRMEPHRNIIRAEESNEVYATKFTSRRTAPKKKPVRLSNLERDYDNQSPRDTIPRRKNRDHSMRLMGDKHKIPRGDKKSSDYDVCEAEYNFKDFCQGKSPGLYSHPNPQCFMQCDQFGVYSSSQCAPGTVWKKAEYEPSSNNRCVHRSALVGH